MLKYHDSKLAMRIRYLLVFLSIFTAPCISSLVLAQNRLNLEEFRIDQEPSEKDWVYFLQMPSQERQNLWSYHAKAGAPFARWSWGWRLGWVKVCSTEQSPFCLERLDDALRDKALVVRAEAATQLGNLFEKSKNKAALRKLEEAFLNPRNARNGKPMFIQKRILEAIHKISGDDARQLGERLAKKNREHTKYWNQISRF